MKKIIIGIALLGSSSLALAGAAGGGGCGWGQMLFEGQSGPAPHVLGETTNVTTGNNTFGMTTGTNGCDTSGKLSYNGKSLLVSIMGEFSEDVARGDGEALNAIAVMYGIEKSDRAAFSKLMHENFTKLFPSESVTAEEVMTSMNEILKADARLAKYVA